MLAATSRYILADPQGAAFVRAHEPLVNRIVYDAVVALGGSISAEHGIGQLKVDELAHYRSRIELDTMRTIKRALDPQNRMNPGKLVALAPEPGKH